jgi:hypothetical protein
MPGFGKVRRFKHIQLQRVTCSEDQMIEITDLLKEVLNVTLIRQIERVPFRFSVERCDRLFNPLRITRRDDCASASRHRLLRDCQSDAGRPAEHYNSFLGKLTSPRGFELTLRGRKVLQELEILLPKMDQLVTPNVFDPIREKSHFRISSPNSQPLVPSAAPLFAYLTSAWLYIARFGS